MRIDASQISYAATHQATSATAVIDQTIAVRPQATARATASVAAPPASSAAAVDVVQLTSGDSGRDDLSDLGPKERLAWLAIEACIGHKLYRRGRAGSASSSSSSASGSSGSGTTSGTAGRAAARSAQVHRSITLHSEAERTTFRAQGLVETSDGRRIQFSANLTMERQFQSVSASTNSGTQAATTDPLVINFGGQPARLTNAKVAFDLNADGTNENISFVADGSGFLALDRNGDGKINDGTELFGPQTGSGFAELAALDTDGNGWIDEADPAYSQLRVWSLDQSSGEAGLSTLAENGVGAIATSSVETPFALTNLDNALQGNIRATGIYLAESGQVGTIQHVDLAG
jgi:hypothetical protein